MHSVLYPREPRLLMPVVCHYKTALSRLQVYRPMAGNFCYRPRPKLWLDNSAVELHAYSRRYLGAARLSCSGRFLTCMGAHCARRCPAAAAVS
jgi:hypothetical protein